jgi:hypothetical protein
MAGMRTSLALPKIEGLQRFLPTRKNPSPDTYAFHQTDEFKILTGVPFIEGGPEVRAVPFYFGMW